MAVKGDSKELAALLDDALDALRKRGELVQIFQSHGLTLAAP
jgi:ABC-type amino acid transport substrate-binding protein